MPKANFTPQTNGFAFVNSWTFDQTESDRVRNTLTVASNEALTLLSPLFGPSFVFFGVGRALANGITNAVPQTYGLCGGMAFAALDYYQAKLAFPRGSGLKDWPTRATPAGAILRTYLWKRLLDSLELNAAQVLVWMVVLYVLPAWWPFNGGSAWLLRESKKEWKSLKEYINAGQPWPIALIGTTKNPCNNHQVLAYGYEDSGDGIGCIYVYDMNCPGAERKIEIDMRGDTLLAFEDCASPTRGPLQGFFCEDYSPVSPP
jgi:hypothetical protein